MTIQSNPLVFAGKYNRNDRLPSWTLWSPLPFTTPFVLKSLHIGFGTEPSCLWCITSSNRQSLLLTATLLSLYNTSVHLCITLTCSRHCLGHSWAISKFQEKLHFWWAGASPMLVWTASWPSCSYWSSGRMTPKSSDSQWLQSYWMTLALWFRVITWSMTQLCPCNHTCCTIGRSSIFEGCAVPSSCWSKWCRVRIKSDFWREWLKREMKMLPYFRI